MVLEDRCTICYMVEGSPHKFYHGHDFVRPESKEVAELKKELQIAYRFLEKAEKIIQEWGGCSR